MLETIKTSSRHLVLRTRALLSFGRLARDPNRLGEVFEMADALSEVDPSSLDTMVRQLSGHDYGAAAFRDRPRIGVIDLDALVAMKKGTLGRTFADHMLANGLVPEAIPTLGDSDDSTYLRAHLYETHDVWHVVAGFGTDVAGELGLQAFYLAQTGGPLPRAILTLGLANGLVYAQGDFDRRVEEIARGFALGRAARPLFGVRWAELWDVPIDELRRRFDLEKAATPGLSEAQA
jgi:ubiquinone biosynthesis protein Coq4